MFIFPQIPHEFDKLFTAKTLIWSISDLHFMKTILSGLSANLLPITDIEKCGR